MEATELAHDLWRWTGRRDTIGADVGSVYYKTGTDILLFDPLLPPEDPEHFWQALDRDVHPGDRVLVLVTANSHMRSAHEMAGRYPGGRLWDGRAPLPAGAVAHPSGRSGELVYWLPERGALVIGDVVVGDGEGGLRFGPNADGEAVAAALRDLAQQPVQLVLPSHGEVVRGADALRALVS